MWHGIGDGNLCLQMSRSIACHSKDGNTHGTDSIHLDYLQIWLLM